jgi:hypothetical protein
VLDSVLLFHICLVSESSRFCLFALFGYIVLHCGTMWHMPWVLQLWHVTLIGKEQFWSMYITRTTAEQCSSVFTCTLTTADQRNDVVCVLLELVPQILPCCWMRRPLLWSCKCYQEWQVYIPAALYIASFAGQVWHFAQLSILIVIFNQNCYSLFKTNVFFHQIQLSVQSYVELQCIHDVLKSGNPDWTLNPKIRHLGWLVTLTFHPTP